jgi:hypothetical protein
MFMTSNEYTTIKSRLGSSAVASCAIELQLLFSVYLHPLIRHGAISFTFEYNE